MKYKDHDPIEACLQDVFRMTSLDPPSYAQLPPPRGDGRNRVNKIKVNTAPNIVEELNRARTAKERKSRLYTIVCLFLIGVVVFGGGIALVVVGDSQNIEDFIIVGGLFLGLGAVFLCLITMTLLKPIRDRKKIAIENSRKTVAERTGYIDQQNTQIDSPDDVKRRPKPSADMLYGYDKVKIHLPGPEVVAPPRYKSTLSPPPPPPVALPRQGVSETPMVMSLPREATLVSSSEKPSEENGERVVFY